jgi:hypothetical protein
VIQLPHFPQAVGPPHPLVPTLNPKYTHVIQFQNWQKMTLTYQKSSWSGILTANTLPILSWWIFGHNGTFSQEEDKKQFSSSMAVKAAGFTS